MMRRMWKEMDQEGKDKYAKMSAEDTAKANVVRVVSS